MPMTFMINTNDDADDSLPRKSRRKHKTILRKLCNKKNCIWHVRTFVGMVSIVWLGRINERTKKAALKNDDDDNNNCFNMNYLEHATTIVLVERELNLFFVVVEWQWLLSFIFDGTVKGIRWWIWYVLEIAWSLYYRLKYMSKHIHLKRFTWQPNHKCLNIYNGITVKSVFFFARFRFSRISSLLSIITIHHSGKIRMQFHNVNW